MLMNPAATGFKYADYTVDALMNDISDGATGRYLYFDGSNWIDKPLDIVTA